jgi:hypothetical protein
VFHADGQFFVSDRESCWRLTADLFGATLHRLGESPPPGEDDGRAAFRISRAGKVSWGKLRGDFDEFREVRSAAGDATTLAVTLPMSHRVYLLAAPLVSPGVIEGGGEAT